MSGLLDISMLVRYLTGDPPEMAERAARIIDWEENLLVTDVVIAETAYILTSVYKIPGEAVRGPPDALRAKEQHTALRIPGQRRGSD